MATKKRKVALAVPARRRETWGGSPAYWTPERLRTLDAMLLERDDSLSQVVGGYIQLGKGDQERAERAAVMAQAITNLWKNRYKPILREAANILAGLRTLADEQVDEPERKAS